MENAHIEKVLRAVSEGTLEVAQALEELKHLPFEDLGCATLDHHRALRQGFPEVIFGQGKSVDQMQTIIGALLHKGSNVLATRVSAASPSRSTSIGSPSSRRAATVMSPAMPAKQSK